MSDITHYAHWRGFWEALDSLKKRGDFLVTDFDNAPLYCSKYREIRSWKYEEKGLNLKCIRTNDYAYMVVCVDNRKTLNEVTQ